MNSKPLWWKLIAGYVFFVFFYQIYDILGGGMLAASQGHPSINSGQRSTNEPL